MCNVKIQSGLGEPFFKDVFWLASDNDYTRLLARINFESLPVVIRPMGESVGRGRVATADEMLMEAARVDPAPPESYELEFYRSGNTRYSVYARLPNRTLVAGGLAQGRTKKIGRLVKFVDGYQAYTESYGNRDSRMAFPTLAAAKAWARENWAKVTRL